MNRILKLSTHAMKKTSALGCFSFNSGRARGTGRYWNGYPPNSASKTHTKSTFRIQTFWLKVEEGHVKNNHENHNVFWEQ